MTIKADDIREIAGEYSTVPGGLLPLLHAVQDRFGYLPEATVPTVAEVLNRSRAEIHGVITFYHFFRQTPPGKRTVYICRSEACQAMGANALVEHAKQSLAIGFHEVTEDGELGLEPVYCLGNCACAPSIRINDDIHGRITIDKWDELIG